MFCNKCGKRIDYKKARCTGCSHKLVLRDVAKADYSVDRSAEYVSKPMETSTAVAPMPAPKSVKPLIFSLAGGLTCLALIVALVVILFGNKTDTSQLIGSSNIFVSGESVTAKVEDADGALKAIDQVGAVYGIEDADKEFELDSTAASGGNTYYRFNQVKGKVPVEGQQLVVAADADGKVITITGSYYDFDDEFEVKHTAKKEDCKKAIEKEAASLFDKEKKLKISDPVKSVVIIDDQPVLVWTSEIYGYTKDGQFQVCSLSVGDKDSKLVVKTSLMAYDNDNTDEENWFDRMGDKAQEIIDTVDKQILRDEIRKIIVYKADDKDWYPGDKECAVLTATGEEKDVPLEIYNHFQKTYDYYDSVLSYKGTDGKDCDIPVYYFGDSKSIISGKCCYVDAEGGLFIFAKDAKGDLDVVAHEYTHAVADNVADFDYAENTYSVALSEAYADVFGELVEIYVDGKADWKHGTRDLSKMPDKETLESTAVKDPYKSSLVISHGAYLMLKGPKNPDGLDGNTLAKLMMSSLHLLNSQSDFADYRAAVEIIAKDMFEKGELTSEQLDCISAVFNKLGIYNKPHHTVVSAKAKIKVTDINGTAYSQCTCKIERMVTSGKSVKYKEVASFEGTEYPEDFKGFEDGGEYRITVSTGANSEKVDYVEILHISSKSKNDIVIHTTCVAPRTWTDEFATYIKNNDALQSFKLIYIDGDDVPELYAKGENGAAVCVFDSASGIVVKEFSANVELTFVEKNNSLMACDKAEGQETSTVYSVAESKLTEKHTFSITKKDDADVYKVGDDEVEEKDFKDALTKAFDKDAAKAVGEGALSKEDILQHINKKQ